MNKGKQTRKDECSRGERLEKIQLQKGLLFEEKGAMGEAFCLEKSHEDKVQPYTPNTSRI